MFLAPTVTESPDACPGCAGEGGLAVNGGCYKIVKREDAAP